MQVRFLNQGDTGLILEVGDVIDRSTAERVTCLDRRLQAEIAAGRLEGVIEVVPTYRSLTVIFDPLQLPRKKLQEDLLPLLDDYQDASAKVFRQWQLPVCYDPMFGPDLEVVAHAKELTTDEVVALHAGSTYTVYMIGFLPGFPYMGEINPKLQMPRRHDPRVRVAKGSVAITGLQTAIYPWESPGGWQLLGRCPVPLFDAQRSQPALLAQGDLVGFNPVTVAEFQRLEVAANTGTLDLTSFLSGAGANHA